MDRLELHVRQSGLDEGGRALDLVVQELLEIAHAVGDAVRRWRHEGGGPRARASDPVLRPAELARLLLCSPALREQDAVDLADQSIREGEPFTESREAVLQRSDVARYLYDIVEWYAWRLVQLEEQQVGQRRLGALDLRREHGLPAHIGVEKELRVREKRGHAVEPTQGDQGRVQCLAQRRVRSDRGPRRKGCGDERANDLAANRRKRRELPGWSSTHVPLAMKGSFRRQVVV